MRLLSFAPLLPAGQNPGRNHPFLFEMHLNALAESRMQGAVSSGVGHLWAAGRLPSTIGAYDVDKSRHARGACEVRGSARNGF